MSQRFHNCVVTATQTKASSYTAGTLGTEHFADDKRKFAHVTGMFGLNSSIDEKAENRMRLNWLVLRESHYNSGRCVHVGTCFDLARPWTCSCF